MMRPEDPPRLLGALSPEDPLARALEAGRADVPSGEAIRKMSAALLGAPVLQAATAKGLATQSAVAGGKLFAVKAASAAIVAVAGGAVLTVALYRSPPALAPPPAPPKVLSAPAPAAPPPTLAPPVAPPTPEPSAPAHAPVPRPPEESEMSLLGRAQAELQADPAKALVLVEAHRRHFPHGDFAQEREVIAIDALMRLGRPHDAERRAAQFEQTFPDSAHLERVKALLQKNPGTSPLTAPNGP